MTNFPQGWISNPDEVDRLTEEEGPGFLFGNTSFKGAFDRAVKAGVRGVFPHLAEKALFRSFRPSFTQRRGTCVGQGTARAIQDSLYYSALQRGMVMRSVEIAVAPIYAGARVIIGNRALRNSDGAYGVWAAQFAKRYKVVPRGVYGTYNLSKQNGDEGLAVSWGSASGRIPDVILQAGEGEVEVYRCMTGDDILDALASGFCLSYCGNRTYSGKNASGISRLSIPAMHCTEALGFALTDSGNVLAGGQQSWGDSVPAGPSVLRYADGEVELRPGMCFVPVEDYIAQLRGGEFWAFQVTGGFRPTRADDIVLTQSGRRPANA